MSSQITMRLMAECRDKGAALQFESDVRERVAAFGSVAEAEMKPYWKIPEWSELCILLRPGVGPEAAFDGVLSALGSGWERHDISADEQWAVWNPAENCTFFSPLARWANVERFPESPAGPP
jgi:hypothetical protein